VEENNWLNNPDLYAPGCILSAYGINFEPILFLEKSTFDPKLIIFKGSMGFRTFEWVGEVRPRTKVIFEYQHLVLKISKSDARATQTEEAMLFLKQYQNEILRLSEFPNVEQTLLTRALAKGELREEESDEFMDLASSCGVSFFM
jgi:hypothetical protein